MSLAPSRGREILTIALSCMDVTESHFGQTLVQLGLLRVDEQDSHDAKELVDTPLIMNSRILRYLS